MPVKREILVVCIGNSLAGDDGVGPAIYTQLASRPVEPDTQYLLLGLGGLALLDHLKGQRLMIVVDAVQFGKRPGYLHVLDLKNIPAAEAQAVSLHGIGLRETLSIAEMLYPERVPDRIVLIGIEGEHFNELGIPLSPEVEAAVNVAASEVQRQIRRSHPDALRLSKSGHAEHFVNFEQEE
jgi:hydrogenase maturation protease